jgi:hypothetical protein
MQSAPLVFPLERERLQQLRQPYRRPPVHDALDNVRREQRQAQDPANVRLPNFLHLGDEYIPKWVKNPDA